jgi:N-acetylglucosamine kinase-like BadF-type ATPase
LASLASPEDLALVYYDGKKTVPGYSGFGFIIGDEGSASNIGKQLIRSYLYRQMPEKYREEFFKKFQLTEEDIRESIYSKPGPNVFLGSLAPYAHERLNEPFFYNIVFDSFKEFIETQVLTFPESKTCSINFVGSVAYHFETVLKDVLNFFDLELGVIIRRPVDGLIEYHKQIILSSQTIAHGHN